jgi:hypothetical protein
VAFLFSFFREILTVLSLQELADLTRTGKDWSTLESKGSKYYDAHMKLAQAEKGFGEHLNTIGAMHEEAAGASEDDDFRASEQVLADLLTGFGGTSARLEAQWNKVGEVVKGHLVDPAKVFNKHVLKDGKDTAIKFHHKRLEVRRRFPS